MPVVAGVDSSTQSCTIELRDADTGRLRGTGRALHPSTTPPVSEQHVSDWWDALRVALRLACRDAGVDPREIAAISVGAQCHGLVALDASDSEIRPVKLWNDTTSAPDVERLLESRPQESWVGEVLLPLNPALTIAKLAWLARNEPENLARVRRLMVPHDWLTFRLTGSHVTDRSDASGTGYFSADQGRFRPDLLGEHVSDAIDWAGALPTVLGPEDAAGVVRADTAAELGLRADVVVGPGGGDQHLAAVGMGLARGEVAFSLGTSGVVFTPTSLPDHRDWSVDYVCDATGGYLPLVCTLNCTKVTDRFAHLLGTDLDGLEGLALSARPERSAVLLAYLDGERSPMRAGSAGVLAGIHSDTSREEVARAAYDGVVQGMVRGMQTLQELAGTSITNRVLAVGGGARSLAYRQFIADRCGRPVTTVDAPEATARGACVQAAAVLHGVTVAELRDRWMPSTLSAVEPRDDTTPGLDSSFRELSAAYDSWYFARP
ncbi:MAG: FGGY family carbohydrate kinase [Propionicimonas sp.]|uniref:xylulokinase n=1 Tax=Propionicimonas sp. TaxID=1955623 RepID=UPI003D0DD3BB